MLSPNANTRLSTRLSIDLADKEHLACFLRNKRYSENSTALQWGIAYLVKLEDLGEMRMPEACYDLIEQSIIVDGGGGIAQRVGGER